MSDSCPVCDDTGKLLTEPCPLCCDELQVDCLPCDFASETHIEGGGVQAIPHFWCELCQKDLQSGIALDEHVKGRKHLYRKGSRPDAKVAAKLREPLSEDMLFEQIARGEFRNIVVCTGAGVSTAAGIPDFRSSGGLFEYIRSEWGCRYPEVLSAPEELLSRHFANTHADAWDRDIEPWLRSMKWNDAKPTATHWFCSWLHRQGWLRRVYTQNVDGLHVHPELGLPSDVVVECHGALRDASIVLYGDSLPHHFEEMCNLDFPKLSKDRGVDLLWSLYIVASRPILCVAQHGSAGLHSCTGESVIEGLLGQCMEPLQAIRLLFFG